MSRIPLPSKITLESFGGCNLRCRLCPTGQRRRGRPTGPMRPEVFAEVMRQLGPSLRAIDFFNWGEPLLNPRLPEFIADAARRGIYTRVSTNLNYLPDAEALVRSGLHHLLVSCDGCSPETYARYQVGGDFATVQRNLEAILRLRRLNPDLRIDWRFIVFAHNRHEVPLVRRRCQELGINADVCPARLDMREEVLRPAGERIADGRAWIPLDSPIYDGNAGTRRTRRESCFSPWTEACVDVDGSVTVCCSSYDREHDMGSLKEQPFEAIWNGPQYQAARAYLSGGGAGGERTLCHICKDNGFQDY